MAIRQVAPFFYVADTQSELTGVTFPLQANIYAIDTRLQLQMLANGTFQNQKLITNLTDYIAPTSFTPTYGTGFSGTGTDLCWYSQNGSVVTAYISVNNHTAAAQATATITNIPIAINATYASQGFLGRVKVNGTFPTTPGWCTLSGTTLTMYVDASTSTNWSGTNNSSFNALLVYPK